MLAFFIDASKELDCDKKKSEPGNRYRCCRRRADNTTTMDWEGGTIGAIVPALMGHGEAGRASPWPFSFSMALKKPGRCPGFFGFRCDRSA